MMDYHNHIGAADLHPDRLRLLPATYSLKGPAAILFYVFLRFFSNLMPVSNKAGLLKK